MIRACPKCGLNLNSLLQQCPSCHSYLEDSQDTIQSKLQASAQQDLDRRAGTYGKIGIILFIIGISLYWYSNHGGWGDGPYHYGALVDVLIAISLWAMGLVASLVGLAQFKQSVLSWIALIVNIVPLVKLVVFLNHVYRP